MPKLNFGEFLFSDVRAESIQHRGPAPVATAPYLDSLRSSPVALSRKFLSWEFWQANDGRPTMVVGAMDLVRHGLG